MRDKLTHEQRQRIAAMVEESYLIDESNERAVKVWCAEYDKLIQEIISEITNKVTGAIRANF